MKFTHGPSCVVFDFLYGPYVVSIADYINRETKEPENRVSIMIMLDETSISENSIKHIAEYMEYRIDGLVRANVSVIEIDPLERDQVMTVLFDAMRRYLH